MEKMQYLKWHGPFWLAIGIQDVFASDCSVSFKSHKAGFLWPRLDVEVDSWIMWFCDHHQISPIWCSCNEETTCIWLSVWERAALRYVRQLSCSTWIKPSPIMQSKRNWVLLKPEMHCPETWLKLLISFIGNNPGKIGSDMKVSIRLYTVPGTHHSHIHAYELLAGSVLCALVVCAFVVCGFRQHLG